jgi:hypothetical protein
MKGELGSKPSHSATTLKVPEENASSSYSKRKLSDWLSVDLSA